MKIMEKKKLRWITIIIGLVIVVGVATCCELNQVNRESATYEPKKFGATYMTMNNPYFWALNDSIEEVVESNGDILITRDPAQDQDKQNSQIQEMIEEGVEAIFLNPVDWKEVESALIACKEAGIPVFNVDTFVYNKEYVVTVIVSDNYNAGVQCAKDVMSKLDHADIIVIGQPNMNSVTERVSGFLDTIQSDINYQVVVEIAAHAELEVAMDVMKDVIKSGIKFDVVMAGNDPTALGALAALQLNHMDDDVLIYGVDGSPDGKMMIKEGYIEGSSAQRPMTIGTTAAKAAYSYLNGEDVPDFIVVPVTLITKENLDQFEIDGWQ